MILKRSEINGYPAIYIFSTYFFQQLLSSNLEKTMNYFDKKGLKLDQYEMILIPFNTDCHWSLIQVNIQTNTIYYYDSLRSICENLIEPLVKLFSNIKNKYNSFRLVDNEDWTIKTIPCPKQKNNNDCGVFVLRFMESISMNKPFNFCQEDMEYLRIVIGIELVKGSLL